MMSAASLLAPNHRKQIERWDLMSLQFVVNNTKGGHPSWWLYSGNTKMVAWAGQTFASNYDATRAAQAFKAGAATARFEVYLDEGGHYRWRAWRSSDKVAASGESFYSRYDAQRAADNVRENAGYATVSVAA
jgi:uncharacterized protein YegP (UPF0339 family)